MSGIVFFIFRSSIWVLYSLSHYSFVCLYSRKCLKHVYSCFNSTITVISRKISLGWDNIFLTHCVFFYGNIWLAGSMVKNLPASPGGARDVSLIPVLGISPGVENGNPLQYSCLENPMGGGAWWATVHGATKSRTRLSDFTSLQPNSSMKFPGNNFMIFTR